MEPRFFPRIDYFKDMTPEQEEEWRDKILCTNSHTGEIFHLASTLDEALRVADDMKQKYVRFIQGPVSNPPTLAELEGC